MASLPLHKYLIAVVGPTAVGKTMLCVQLAQHFRTEVVSADARQCYQKMAIGTAQPTAAEKQGVPHHLMGYLPIQTPYSAGMFERDALRMLAVLFRRHNRVILTGGSGLYVKAVCEGLDTMPRLDTSVREYLNTRLQQAGLRALIQELAARDPAYFQIVDRCNPHRIIRALAVCLATGKPYSASRRNCPAERPFKVLKVGLSCNRQVLYEQINQRVERMLSQGLWAEAAALYAYRDYHALKTVGYQEIFKCLSGHYSRQEAVALIKRNTRRYAKRQLTWFGGDEAIRWFQPGDLQGVINYINQYSLG
ncbi:MAG: tRNA (adenosine(37)-N6)-dimethylallyltransferase MiaA [Bacteroidota bacterium]